MVRIPHKILGHRWDSWDNALLAAAIFIDIADFLPFNLPVSALEALFLLYLGVHPSKTLIAGIIDLIPIVNLFPWCTLAVLHKRYGVRLGGLSALFSETEPARDLRAGPTGT